MSDIDTARSNQIVQALKSKGVDKACPRCGGLHFGVVAETFLPINDGTGNAIIGGPVVPTVIVACKNCGFVTQHALGALGIDVEVHARAG